MVDALYIHLPFCVRKCLYCDFLSVPFTDDRAEDYTGAVCRELSLKSSLFAPLRTLYIGGGTPTLLGEERLSRLLCCVRDTCRLAPDTEITLEANPGTVSRALLELLHALGVNRLSIGVQSFQNSELSMLGRIHDSAEAEQAIALARRLGFNNISLDLMYGIPGQALETWKATLAQAVRLGAAHISAYELTPEQGTPLTNLLESGKLQLPDEELVLDMYGYAIDFLGRQGYQQYEISNFARPGLECRHNLNYWNRGEYVGVGAGAHSFVGGARCYNSSDLAAYETELRAGRLPQTEEQALTDTEVLREYIFLGLRKSLGIPLSGSVFSPLPLLTASTDLIEAGYLKISAGYLSFTRSGQAVSNMVIARLLNNLNI